MGFSGRSVLRQVDERDTLAFCILPSPRGSPEVVSNVSDDEICPLDHPFVAAENGILRRHVFERGVDDLIEKVVSLFKLALHGYGQMRHDKAVSKIFRSFLCLLHASGSEAVKRSISARVADERLVALGEIKQLS